MARIPSSVTPLQRPAGDPTSSDVNAVQFAATALIASLVSFSIPETPSLFREGQFAAMASIASSVSLQHSSASRNVSPGQFPAMALIASSVIHERWSAVSEGQFAGEDFEKREGRTVGGDDLDHIVGDPSAL